MKRAACLKLLSSLVDEQTLVVTTLGWTAGEWYAVRPSDANFYQVNMGLCTPLALGLALALPHRRVIALDSDGSILLYMGNLATLANQAPANLIDIVFDNESYFATGGLPTATAGVTDLALVAKGAGITEACCARTLEEFGAALGAALKGNTLSFIVAKVEQAGQRLSTPFDGKEGKYHFVRHLERSEGIKIIGTHAMKT